MRNYKNKMTALRVAVYEAKTTQAQLAHDAGITEAALSLAATGRMSLGERSGERVRAALARRGVTVSLQVARGL